MSLIIESAIFSGSGLYWPLWTSFVNRSILAERSAEADRSLLRWLALIRPATLESWTWSAPASPAVPELLGLTALEPCWSAGRICWLAPAADEEIPDRLLSSMRIEAFPARTCVETGPPIESIGRSWIYFRPCDTIRPQNWTMQLALCFFRPTRRGRESLLCALTPGSCVEERPEAPPPSLGRRQHGGGALPGTCSLRDGLVVREEDLRIAAD